MLRNRWNSGVSTICTHRGWSVIDRWITSVITRGRETARTTRGLSSTLQSAKVCESERTARMSVRQSSACEVEGRKPVNMQARI
jgi:hypothetical protein